MPATEKDKPTSSVVGEGQSIHNAVGYLIANNDYATSRPNFPGYITVKINSKPEDVSVGIDYDLLYYDLETGYTSVLTSLSIDDAVSADWFIIKKSALDALIKNMENDDEEDDGEEKADEAK